jgi:hypothetical protein
MLCGRRPLDDPDPMTLMRLQVAQSPPELHEITGAQPWQTAPLRALVTRGLEKRPEARFATAAEMIAALDAAFVSLDHLPAGI